MVGPVRIYMTFSIRHILSTPLLKRDFLILQELLPGYECIMIPLMLQTDLHALALKTSLHLLGVVLLCLKLFGRGLIRSDALLLQNLFTLLLLLRLCSVIFLMYSE